MRFFTRLPAPAVLTELVGRPNPVPRWIHIGNRYIANRQRKPGFDFQWPTVRKQTLNLHLLPTLRGQTANHCSYCDSYPLKKGDESIDHFLPKQHPDYYTLVCQWENLYLACAHCQASKKSDVNPLVLRPDHDEYAFSSYFVYDFSTHQIEIRPRLQPQDEQRARVTRQFFDFNHPALVKCRERAFDWHESKSGSKELDDFDFRFMFDF